MTKEEIGSILKQLRIASGKTQKEVAEILGRKQQIVGHWETGYSQPDANTLFTLCEIYGTTVDSAFGFKKTNISFHDFKLLEKYNSLDDYGKETIDIILERELKNAEAREAAKKRIRTYAEALKKMQDNKSQKIYYSNPQSLSMVAESPTPYGVDAAHERTDIEVTDEMRQHDDDIMNDDSEWE